MKTILIAMATFLLTTMISRAEGQITEPAKDTAKNSEPKAQVTCPVMGGEIDKNLFVDVKGCRIYVCCGGCVAKIKADPDKYLAKIKANGETPAKAPAVDKESKKENKKGEK